MTKTSSKEESTTMENESRAHTTKVIIPLAVPIVGEDENSGFLRVERKDYAKSHKSKKRSRTRDEIGKDGMSAALRKAITGPRRNREKSEIKRLRSKRRSESIK